MKHLGLIGVLLVLVSCQGQTDCYDLLCEGLDSPLGIDTTVPHFSWKHKLTRNGQGQTAYEIEVGSDIAGLNHGEADLWKSGKVESDCQVMVPYAGLPLSSRQLCYWRLRTWDEKGRVSAWSKAERFAIGVLDGLSGDYIGCDAESAKLKTSIHLTKLKGSPVFAHINSLGYHELYVNGSKVGDYVLQPAMSQLDRHSLIVCYDITPYLHKGENELIIWLGQGWYKAVTFNAQHPCPLVKAEVCQLSDGLWNMLAKSDSTWEAAGTAISYTGSWYPLRFGGEMVDAGLAETWQAARCYQVDSMRATPQLFEGNRITDRLDPVSVTNLEDGSLLLDFGRIVTGWLQAGFAGLKKGDKVTMEYSDYIPVGASFESQGESDVYVASGQAPETFCNRFHHHAFRYVRITGAPGVNAQALQISALPRCGDKVSSFACSDDRLNAVHDMIHYTMQCLTFSGYMVDCPHLERMGYGGDGNSSTMTLQTMYDVAPTYMNWLEAWGYNVESDGSLPYVAPAGGGGGGPYWSGFIIKAPWRTYLNYGDRRPMERMYDKMKLWLGYVRQNSAGGLLQPWPDTRNRMWFLGDWLAPDGVDMGGESVIHANNCFIVDCLGDMASMARVLGRTEDEQEFAAWQEDIRKALNDKYFHDGIYANGTPLDMSYALLAGVPSRDTLYNCVNNRLVEDSRGRYGSHIAAGLFGVPVFTEWAIKNRQADLMADILRQPDYPGYLHMIANGATATWEYWNGERSRVHNCYNGIGTWFYQALAGLRPDESSAGYRHFVIDPQYPEGVTWVRASKPTPYGLVEVYWKKNEDTGIITLEVTIPVGSTATVYGPGPDGDRHALHLSPGHHVL